MSDNWDDIAVWWTAEAADDPAYRFDVHPLLLELLPDDPGRVVDLGCGDGQGMEVVTERGTCLLYTSDAADDASSV